jgi:CRISPR system Cascade subunit CasD
MTTLLLRLAGPMQSWGTQSRFSTRDTGREPSKSGVVGLLCAALGRARAEPVADLAALKMGVRVELEGMLQVDYQTAGGSRRGDYGVPTADGRSGGTVVSRRYYLADADFLVGLEGDVELLKRLDAALTEPVWQVFLGRKSFVPAWPVRFPHEPPLGPGLREGGVEENLRSFSWAATRRPGRPDQRRRLVLECEPGHEDAEVRLDVPISFASRRFGVRYVRTAWASRPVEVA